MSPIDRELERALARQAGAVSPPADLYAAVTKEAGAMRRRRQIAISGTALSVVALAIAVPLLLRRGDGSGEPRGFTSAGPTPTASDLPTTDATTEPTTEPTVGPSPTDSAPDGIRTTVPVYWVMDSSRGLRLYREFLDALVNGGASAQAAVDRMLAGGPRDPDYTSVWPKGSTATVTTDGDLATVDLNDVATEANAGGQAEAISVQQLVYTVTAADNSVRRVQILVEGRQRETLWGHVDIRRPVSRDSHVDVLGAVWLEKPGQGSAVARTFTLSGQATVFEATVSWEVYRVDCASGTACPAQKVAEGFATATEGGPGRGTWEDSVTIPATVPAGSTLEVRAFESSAENGEPLHTDTKRVTLR
jgi:hypothetical protein